MGYLQPGIITKKGKIPYIPIPPHLPTLNRTPTHCHLEDSLLFAVHPATTFNLFSKLLSPLFCLGWIFSLPAPLASPWSLSHIWGPASDGEGLPIMYILPQLKKKKTLKRTQLLGLRGSNCDTDPEGFLAIHWDFFSHVVNSLGFDVDGRLGIHRGRTRKWKKWGRASLDHHRMAGYIDREGVNIRRQVGVPRERRGEIQRQMLGW